ncbi:peptide chain release factor N(5)-glutamine methyltransferase [Devosia sp. LjRoot3]|uniref:peptide chain release factor N(5)-glutamine methyltransferase n=1 Tax=Devosia sp. LjRoot3 TaxID=3342319 RepID=UPI003ECCF246
MSEDVSVGALWRRWRDELSQRGFATATLDAKLLVGHALGFDALQLATRESELVSRLLASDVTALMTRRLTGESVARIIGHREFYGLEFELNEATLEPRPDTELLVDFALKALPQGGRFVDLGTGSGCIPIAVLANRPDARGVASDINPRALEMAGRNAERNGVSDRLTLLQGDWFGALIPPPSIPPHKGEGGDGTDGSGFDLILSNPPYISSEIVETLAPEVRDFDPRLALDGGPDGLGPYRIIAAEAAHWLKPGGQVLVEIGYDQGAVVSNLFEAAGFSRIGVTKDLAGLDRVVSAHHI